MRKATSREPKFKVGDECPRCCNGILVPETDEDGILQRLLCDEETRCGHSFVAADAGKRMEALRDKVIAKLLKHKRPPAPCLGDCPRCRGTTREEGQVVAEGSIPMLLDYDYCGDCHYILVIREPQAAMPRESDNGRFAGPPARGFIA